MADKPLRWHNSAFKVSNFANIEEIESFRVWFLEHLVDV